MKKTFKTTLSTLDFCVGYCVEYATALFCLNLYLFFIFDLFESAWNDESVVFVIVCRKLSCALRKF